MATETLILRPTYSVQQATASVNSSLGNIDPTNAWSLVAEEVADDDATWVQCGALNSPAYSFTISEEYRSKTPTNIRVYIRAVTDATSGSPYLIINLNDFDKANLYSLETQHYLSTSYQTFYEDITDYDMISAWYNVLANKDPTEQFGHMHISFSTGGTGGKNVAVYLTQLYLELTYDDGPISNVETIYLKQNGVWISISGDIYKKQNGAWALSNSSELQDGFRYILNDMTTS